MTSIADCFAGLRDVSGLGGQINAYTVGDTTISAPCVVVSLTDVNAVADMGGTIEAEFELAVLVDRTHPDQFDQLLALCEPAGASSLFAAFDDDPTLGGLVADTQLNSVGGFGTISYGSGEYYGAIIKGVLIGTS